MARMVSDCREMPSEKNCTLTIAGEESEVLDAATQHAVSAHGHRNTPELREGIRRGLKPERGDETWTPTGRIDAPDARH